MRYYLHTTGCKANQWDSYVIDDRIRSEGFVRSGLAEADVIVINACTVTGGAERDLRRFINRARRMNGKALVVLVGCHAQVNPDDMCGADILLGQGEKFDIARYLQKGGSHVADTRQFTLEQGPSSRPRQERTRFFLKIQDGCDAFCSYCVVPFARGKPRSRPVPEITSILGNLYVQGIGEAVLTGIEISAYRDPESGIGLKELLRMLEAKDTPPRLRLSSIDPLYTDDVLIDIVASSKKLARSFHIPMQSGCDRVLKDMNRSYSASYMKDLIERLTKRIDGVGIGIDVIVGFPTEDDGAFDETFRLIDALPVYYLHVFPYSPRRGAIASKRWSDLPEAVKKSRVKALKTLDLAKRRAFSERFLEKEVSIIPEGKVYWGSHVRGYTENYLPVYVRREKTLENILTRVRIKEIRRDLLFGEVLH
jgi:threonylcarbamoyladenosine tRNA methylthiotransferase MtaB